MQKQRSDDVGFLNQTRRTRRWVSLSVGACALVVVAIVTTLVWNDVAESDGPRSEQAANVIRDGREVPLDAAVIPVARTWILGTVTRADLARTYALTDPDIRGSMSRAEWELGVIPVIPFPVATFSMKAWRIVFSRAREALLEVRLIPTTRVRTVAPRTFSIGLKLVGSGTRLHWVVNYWSPKIRADVRVSGSS